MLHCSKNLFQISEKSRGKLINLALRGDGSPGALTSGVLDRLLEDDRLMIAEIRDTSAGAVNAVVSADKFERGVRERRGTRHPLVSASGCVVFRSRRFAAREGLMP